MLCFFGSMDANFNTRTTLEQLVSVCAPSRLTWFKPFIVKLYQDRGTGVFQDVLPDIVPSLSFTCLLRHNTGKIPPFCPLCSLQVKKRLFIRLQETKVLHPNLSTLQRVKNDCRQYHFVSRNLKLIPISSKSRKRRLKLR